LAAKGGLVKNRLFRLLKVLEGYPRTGAPDLDAMAAELGTVPDVLRRDLRDLRDAGAFGPTGPVELVRELTDGPDAVLPKALRQRPANDGVGLSSGLSDDEATAMYVGARFLLAQGDPTLGRSAQAMIARIEHAASLSLLERLNQIDRRYNFGPHGNERAVRQLANQAITERRVLTFRYFGERDVGPRERVVEPMEIRFTNGAWFVRAYCRGAKDIRQFRAERCLEARLLEERFSPRNGHLLDQYIQQHRRSKGRE
jgi:predicted DNA-binding transcriptional regulator YafY